MRLLADEFYFLAHSDVTGKPRLHHRATALGLAASLLAELLAINKITIDGGRLIVLSRTSAVDGLDDAVLGQILAEPEHVEVSTWLMFLSESATDDVAFRLRGARLLRAERSRIRLRQEVRFVPTDMNRAAASWARVSVRLRNHKPLDEFDLMLAALMTATGLDRYVLDGAPRAAYAHLRGLIDQDASPSLAQLCSLTGAAVGNAVLSHRT